MTREDPLFDLTEFSAQVRAKVESLGLKYRDVAPLAGVSYATLNRMIKARGRPDVETYLRLRRWLDPDRAP